MTRADKRKGPFTREDLLAKGSGLSGEVRGNYPNLLLRDISSSLGGVTVAEDGENLVTAVRELLSLINGPVAAEINQIGKYINERGEYVGP